MPKKWKNRESYSGLHFFQLYQNCPRKFFLKYVARLIPKYTAQPLIFGSAFHYGCEVFYKSKKATIAVEEAEAFIEKQKEAFANGDEYASSIERIGPLLGAWINKFGRSDLQEFDFLAIEDEIVITIPGTNGMVITMKPDTVVRSKATKKIFVLEKKTAGFKIITTLEGVYLGDQATSYAWAVREKFGRVPDGIIADVAYWSKMSKKIDGIECVRGDIITRTDNDVNEFVLSAASVIQEISSKIEAFSTGDYPVASIFPRNTYYCTAYMKTCEFADICRSKVKLRGKAPYGFRRDQMAKPLSITDYTQA